MEAPDKIFLYRGHPEPYWFKDKQLDSDIEYIRKEALMEWAKNMRRICKDAEPIEKAYQTVIDKINSM